jgi:phage recombination protein Bet
MAMSSAIITHEAAEYTTEQRKLITDVLCKGATSTEVDFFMQVAKRCRLDPFKRQIHAVKRWDNALGREAMTFQVGIDGLRAIADRTGAYAGNDDAVFLEDDKGRLIKATCTVYKLVGGQRVSFTASALYSECVQTKKGGDPNSMWAKRPYGQLAKCAEAMALRKAFPEDTGGLYTEEEIDADEGHRPSEPNRSQPISDYPAKKLDSAEPVEAEVVVTHWSELLPDAWRKIQLLDGPFKGMQMVRVAQEIEPSKWAASNLDSRTTQGMALFASRWMKIERILAAMNMTTAEFEGHLIAAHILDEGQSAFDVGGERLPDLFTFARTLQAEAQPSAVA